MEKTSKSEGLKLESNSKKTHKLRLRAHSPFLCSLLKCTKDSEADVKCLFSASDIFIAQQIIEKNVVGSVNLQAAYLSRLVDYASDY